MYSTHNEGKSVVAERLIRTWKTKIYKYLSSVSKNVYINKLDYTVGEYNNTYHRTIAKGYRPNWSEKFLLLVKLKIQFHGHMLLMFWIVKKLLEHFMKKNYKTLNKKNLE